MTISFIKKYLSDIGKLENVSTDFRPPAHWYHSGNYAINRILSGDYHRGIPQGRVTILAGPSDCVSGDQRVTYYKLKTNPMPFIKVVVD